MANATCVDTIREILLPDIVRLFPRGNPTPSGYDRVTSHARHVEEFFDIAEGFLERSKEAVVEELQYWTNDAKHLTSIHHFLVAKIKLPQEGEFQLYMSR